MGFRLPPGIPPWVPSLVFLTLFFSAGIFWSVKFGPKVRTAAGWPQGPLSSVLVGHLFFRSATRWLVVWSGFVLVMIAIQMGLVGLPFLGVGVAIMLIGYLRTKGAVQSCYVHPSGVITLIRGDVAIPFDLNHFQYIRMYTGPSRTASRYPSMLVLHHDTEPSGSTWLSSVFLPRVDSERVVLFYNRWYDAENAILGPIMVDDLFYQACVRAGRPPGPRRGGLFGEPGWDVRPQ